MKAVAITGPGQCEIVDQPDPRIRNEFVKVRILSAPMCTEFKMFAAGDRSDCLGHEAAGVVEEVARPGRVAVGDRVVVMPQYPCGKCPLCMRGDYIHCQDCVSPRDLCGSETGTATYAQFCIKQDWLLLPIPDEVPTDHAAMACCGVGPTFGAMQRMRVDRFDTVLIVGLGAVGLGGVINGVYRGARVIGVEGNPYRAKLARELGAAEVVDPADPEALRQVRSLAGGRGADRVLECTAVPAAQQFAVQAARRRGQVAFVGWGGRIVLDNMIPEGLTLHGCWHWNLRDAPKILRMIRDTGGLLSRAITHTFPMSRAREAFELQVAGQCGKVVLHPWE